MAGKIPVHVNIAVTKAPKLKKANTNDIERSSAISIAAPIIIQSWVGEISILFLLFYYTHCRSNHRSHISKIGRQNHCIGGFR